MTSERVIEILQHFNINNIEISVESVSHGYINDTYLISVGTQPSYILQQLNTKVFSSPDAIQYNIDRASHTLVDKNYKAVEFIKTKNQSSLLYLNDAVFRLMKYVEGSHVFSTAKNESIAFEAGRIIGVFHRLLADEDLFDYKISLPDFHKLSFRVSQFEDALKHAKIVDQNTKDEIDFAMLIIPEFDLLQTADLPLRLCHNDTKLNNILFDKDNKALCLIDLDTIMPGYFHYDFGDAVRTIVNPASEDERDLTKIEFNMNLFKAFINGLKSSGLTLTEKEIDYLPLSAALMPFLQGLRMLTDHLNGNLYYKVSYPDQNLDRCRSLFNFTKIALNKKEEMRQFTEQLK